MDIEEIKRRKMAIIERFGPWTAHNIQLRGDICTADKQVFWGARSLQRIIQVISDVAGAPLRNLRILDLACLEGVFGIECARHGAEVVGIEGREANIRESSLCKGCTFAG